MPRITELVFSVRLPGRHEIVVPREPGEHFPYVSEHNGRSLFEVEAGERIIHVESGTYVTVRKVEVHAAKGEGFGRRREIRSGAAAVRGEPDPVRQTYGSWRP
ncbi:MAG: hypothetical protein AAF532_02140 [Planctomycetota bacterium]